MNNLLLMVLGALTKVTRGHPAVQEWWVIFLKNLAIPNHTFNFLVPWGKLLVGIGLLIGCFTKNVLD
ncbi:hypothetical protein [Paenisporosarcina sp. OV554]|uniref:hypothetical protein n=1 Tax=Paenisporosarcina sp. OV554 TaxID=2135694 RepID=UPI000D35A310